MRALFLVSDTDWSARARAFVLAARGLAARGHEVQIACDAACPVQMRAAEAEVPVIALSRDMSTAGSAWNLRGALKERGADVVFVHTDAEHLMAGSALRLGGGVGAVIRRIPPFAIAGAGAGSRLAPRLAPSGLLFTTEADRQAATARAYRVPSALATLGVDLERHDSVPALSKESLGVPADSRLIVCVQDGGDTRFVLTALRSLSLLAPRHADLHLAIVGSDRQDELRMHGAALGISSMLTFLGARQDELSVLRAADIGWIAAEGDGAALAALDFMALGKAVVADRSPLTAHYLADGIAGVLLSPADPPTTAGTVAAFVADEERRAAMGTAARARVQREFAFDAMIAGFERAASAAMERHPQPVG
ncbi:MAG: glycosyltransferase family 4 protein [Gemmatimonadaceae bacterium]